MRIGSIRLAQKPCPKHLPIHCHISSSTSSQKFVHFPKHAFEQSWLRPQVLRHDFTTAAKKLDEAEVELRQQNETRWNAQSGSTRRWKQKTTFEAGMKSLEGLRSGPPKSQKKNAASWSSKLNDIYLQAGASSSHGHSSTPRSVDDDVPLRILDIMYEANKPYNAGVEIFTYMGIEQGKWKAVLWLADTLLQNVATRMPDPSSVGLPSNVVWGSENVTLEDLTQHPFSVTSLAYASTRPIEDTTTLRLDPKYSDLAADNKDRTLRTMKQIWQSIGNMIIEAAELPDDLSEVVMAIVYQIIAKVHALDLVPDNVYSHASSCYSSTVTRPPILHLVSSRILTTLSDATWRSHQMEIIEQAVSLGTPLQSLVKDLPGGRFRLKVRPLGPEIWLEFVLWCCVEGGFGSTGVHLVKTLQQRTQSPWFAQPWASQTGNALSSTVDWDRVRSRHGGSVGLIEGYNRQPPFVEMAPHTVSAEVVLMLVETMVNSVNTGVSGRSFSMRSVVSKAIPSLVEFLEPHSLAEGYFDYIAVRLLQTGAFDVEQDPAVLELWIEKVSDLRSLESVFKSTPASATFEVLSIIKQSEVYAGMLHQAMEAYVDNFDVRSAINVFNRIQELVDSSKMQSISAFLATTSVESHDFFNSQAFFSPHTSTSNIDFLHSHGQLPLHKLASFLSLTTDSKLFGIGQWLLYSEDVDEPVIPRRVYDRSALTTALVRFAGASGDEELLAMLVQARRNSRLLPSISLLRSLVDALVSNYNFREAHKVLTMLTEARGGGYGPKNLASLAAAILNIESRTEEVDHTAADSKLSEAWQLLGRLMNGCYDGRAGAIRNDIDAIYRQQIAALLVVFSSILGSQLSAFAKRWTARYPLSNSTFLMTNTFNVILASVVDTKGSAAGMRLWRLFCDDCLRRSDVLQDVILDGISIEDEVLTGYDDYNLPEQVGLVPTRIAAGGEHVPFVDFSPGTSLEIGAEAGEKQIRQHNESEWEIANVPPVLADVNISAATSMPRPRVKPDLRTLRIIVQGALAERQAREKDGLGISLQSEVLRWAAQFYHQLGTSREIIQQEVQLPVHESASQLEVRRRQDERRMRLKVAAAASNYSGRQDRASYVYKQFHGWRPINGKLSEQ